MSCSGRHGRRSGAVITHARTYTSRFLLATLRRGSGRRLTFAREVMSGLQVLPPRTAIALATAALACVAVGDELTGPDAAFTILYLGPIAFGTWCVSRRTGLTLSTVSAIVAVLVDHGPGGTALPIGVAVWNVAVYLGTFFALVVALSALKARLELEQRLARTDPLTLVSNRRAFVEQAWIELERARRTTASLTVVYLDCDDFKVVNDLMGHSQGDALLCKVAGTLRGATRAVDVVARLGGDEFGLLLVDADALMAGALIQRLRAALSVAMERDGWAVSFSMGAATFRTPPRSVDEMLRHADELMYEAKRSGKGGVKLATFGDERATRSAGAA
jgi:diguanylate cyclase (GGDEF)-like protein